MAANPSVGASQCIMPFLVFGPLSSGGRVLPQLILIGTLVVLALLGYVQAIERCRERRSRG